MGENRLLRSFSHLFLFYIILSFFLLYKINVCQCAQADYYPKQNPLNQRLYSNCFQYINRKRSTDEKHGNRQSFTGNTVNSRSQLWYSIQQISVYYGSVVILGGLSLVNSLHAYTFASLKRKKLISTTPLNDALNALILALNASAAAFVLLFTKKFRILS